MTNEELIAFCTDKGVPLPETCKKLNWQGKKFVPWQHKTFFFWFHFRENGKEYVELGIKYMYPKVGDDPRGYFYVSYDTYQKWEDKDIISPMFVYPAPQMHEIAKNLPPKINYDFKQMEFINHCDVIGYDGDNEHIFEKNIVNLHYAQAYTELYIELRDAGLITA